MPNMRLTPQQDVSTAHSPLCAQWLQSRLYGRGDFCAAAKESRPPGLPFNDHRMAEASSSIRASTTSNDFWRCRDRRHCAGAIRGTDRIGNIDQCCQMYWPST